MQHRLKTQYSIKTFSLHLKNPYFFLPMLVNETHNYLIAFDSLWHKAELGGILLKHIP